MRARSVTGPRLGAAALAALTALAGPAPAQPLTRFDASGANAAAIQTTVDAFRTALGSLNPNFPGSFGSGRREINWDGVPAGFSAPNNLPANFFNANSPRGAVFSTAGTGFQVSGNTNDGGVGQPAPANFGNINPTYTNTFVTFSPQRLFTALGSNVLDVTFFLPGSATPLGVRGFGAVFTDVDVPANTSIQYFDLNNTSLGLLTVGSAGANNGLTFLGATATSAASEISRVRITAGNVALGAGVNDGGAVDLVVMDDFIYGEPSQVPEPASLTLAGLGAAAWAWRRRRQAKE